MSLDFITDLQERVLSEANGELVRKMDTCEIQNWEFRDRQDFELGDIELLAKSIKSNGQAQPIIVVKTDHVFKAQNESKSNYVVIAGYRRWLACKSYGLKVDAIVRSMTFEQAISCLITENDKETVSDYSKGIFYNNILKNEGINKPTLYERLGLTKSVLNNFLSFNDVPPEVWKAVGDLRKVSARTSATIRLLCLKGQAYQDAIVLIAPKIAEGIGARQIETAVNKIINKAVIHNTIINNHRVEFPKLGFMECKNDMINIHFNKISSDHYTRVMNRISKVLEEIVNEI